MKKVISKGLTVVACITIVLFSSYLIYSLSKDISTAVHNNYTKLVENQISSLQYELKDSVVNTGSEFLFWSKILQDNKLYSDELKDMEDEFNSILSEYEEISSYPIKSGDTQKFLNLINRLGGLRYKWYKSYKHLLLVKEPNKITNSALIIEKSE